MVVMPLMLILGVFLALALSFVLLVLGRLLESPSELL